MKKTIALLVVAFCTSLLARAQSDYKVVFDLTSSDTNNHKAVIRWISLITESQPQAQLEVVFYGQSLDMIVKDKSTVAADVTRLAANKNVAFKVCAIAMKHHNIDKSQLLPGVQTVPDGIYELISKQREGWGYIKAVR